MSIDIRSANPEDADMVSWIVFAALDIYDSITEKMLLSCSEADTLYSWDNTRLISVDGKVVGGLIAYQGSEYSRLREKTWPMCWDEDKSFLDSIEQECLPGEYYLDSMALLPEYRGQGLGKALIIDAIEQGKKKGCASATLLADKDKIGLVNYYKIIGFEIYDSMIYFGHDYWKMKYTIK